MFIPVKEFGRYGLVTDRPSHNLPVAAWSAGRNVKFNGLLMRRAKEPLLVIEHNLDEELLWMLQFWDGTETRLAAASSTTLYIWDKTNEQWNIARGGLSSTDDWQAFAWGNSCVFYNRIDTPQVYNATDETFVDLPNWGQLTSGDIEVTCQALLPFKQFLIAINTVEGGESRPNTVWWSDAAFGPDLWDPTQAPVWDYELANNLSGQIQIGLEDGPLQWGSSLGEGMVLYTNSSAHSMLLVGDIGDVFNFRRLFDYGCAGLYCAVEFNNFNLVVDAKTIYVHDGNRVIQVAEDRVKETFFNDLFVEGSAPLEIDLQTGVRSGNPFASIRMAVNPPSREVYIYYDSRGATYDVPNPAWTDGGGEPAALTKQLRTALIYNYEDDNWTFVDASVEKDVVFEPGGAGQRTERTLVPVNTMQAGLGITEDSSWQEWEDNNVLWSELNGVPWSTIGDTASTTELYWLTVDGIYFANKVTPDNLTIKKIFVEKTHIDLDGMNAEMTTNYWHMMRKMYPHIEGDGIMKIAVGWSPNLSLSSINTTFKQEAYMKLTMEGADPDAKIDFRTSGRYLALRFEFNECTEWIFTGLDLDVVPMRYDR